MIDRYALAHRLELFRSDAMREHGVAIKMVDRQATLAGALSGSRMHIERNRASEEAFRKAAGVVSRHLWAAYGADAAGLADEVDQHLAALRNEILARRSAQNAAAVAFGESSDWALAQLKPRLDDVLAAALHDFRAGVVAGERLRPIMASNTNNFYGSINHSFVHIDQSNDIGRKEKTLAYDIKNFLSHSSLSALPEPERLEVNELVEPAILELANPQPDKGKVQRALTRVLGVVEKAGEGALTAVATGLLSQAMGL